MSPSRTLVIVPCGKAKIWDHHAERGPTPAARAYTGVPFKINRAYAERFGDSWVVLSAKYGFRRPDFRIRGPYDVTFNRLASHPIASTVLRNQVRANDFGSYDHVIGLGGRRYRERIVEAFAGSGVDPDFPFAGMGLGPSLHAVNLAISLGR